eukprot:8144021-Ditylum_brightwellii.AAC.1
MLEHKASRTIIDCWAREKDGLETITKITFFLEMNNLWHTIYSGDAKPVAAPSGTSSDKNMLDIQRNNCDTVENLGLSHKVENYPNKNQSPAEGTATSKSHTAAASNSNTATATTGYHVQYF